MNVGEVWAHRARRTQQPARVQILKIGVRRPLRVQVLFLDDEFEGRREWVSPAQLKVPWQEVDQWLARDHRWNAVRDRSRQARGTPEHRAAEIIFDHLGLYRLIDARNAGQAVLVIDDRATFENDFDLEAELLRDPLAFLDEGRLVAPWPAMSSLAHRAAVARSRDLPVTDPAPTISPLTIRSWASLSGSHPTFAVSLMSGDTPVGS